MKNRSGPDPHFSKGSCGQGDLGLESKALIHQAGDSRVPGVGAVGIKEREEIPRASTSGSSKSLSLG